MISTMISSVMKMKYSNIKKAAKAAGEKSVEMIHVIDEKRTDIRRIYRKGRFPE